MAVRRDSWAKNYDSWAKNFQDLDVDVPVAEREAILQTSAMNSQRSTPEPDHITTPPEVHVNSSMGPSTSAGGGGGGGGPPSPPPAAAARPGMSNFAMSYTAPAPTPTSGASQLASSASAPPFTAGSHGPHPHFALTNSSTSSTSATVTLLASDTKDTHTRSHSGESPLSLNTNNNNNNGGGGAMARSPRASSFKASPFPSSPLNPGGSMSTTPATTAPGANTTSGCFASPFARPGSRGSAYFARIASEESRTLGLSTSPHSMSTTSNSGSMAALSSRGSMILYRVADPPSFPSATGQPALGEESLLPPNVFSHLNRGSVHSSSGDSIVSLSSDSKYPGSPGGQNTLERGIIAYAYDPDTDDASVDGDEPDPLHDPDYEYKHSSSSSSSHPSANSTRPLYAYNPYAQKGWFGSTSWRGFLNVTALFALVMALLCLFVVYPVVRFYNDNGRNFLITRNTRINATGQAEPVSFDTRYRDEGVLLEKRQKAQVFVGTPLPVNMKANIDPHTPLNVHTVRSAAPSGQDQQLYDLVFSDEFADDGRDFESRIGTESLFIASREDAYDPSQVSTSHGKLVVRFDWASAAADSASDAAPITTSELNPRSSGMLRTRVPLCLGSGSGAFVEVGFGGGHRKDTSTRGMVRGRIRRKMDEREDGGGKKAIYWIGTSSSGEWVLVDSNSDLDDVDLESDGRSLALDLRLGVPVDGTAARLLSSSTSSASAPESTTIAVDYLRVYIPKVQGSTSGSLTCALGRSNVASVVLDVLEAEAKARAS